MNENFWTNYSEINFEIRGTGSVALKHSTFDLLLTIDFHKMSMKHFRNPNYK